jgi:signal peptide peptidase SppA
MGNSTMRKEYPDSDQRYAVCESRWDKSKAESGRLSMANKQTEEVTLWLGNFSSYATAEQALQRADNAMETGAYSDYAEEEEDGFQGYGYMVQRMGDTAIIQISGQLITKSNFLTRLFGMTGYDEISNAVAAASSADGISSILLDIDSPGGSANGVEQAADTVSKVNSDVMPVTSWTGGTMASAAYWIGSAAGKVFSTPMATVGSIGTIAVHQEISKMLKEEGINATVFRSGQYKGLGNPYEPLTDKAKEVIQSKIDSLSDHFISKVAEYRGRTSDYIKANAAEGREFFGKDAVGVGLVDGLQSFEEVVKLIDKDHNSPRAENSSELYTGADTMLRKKVMTQEAQAAIAAGVPVDAALEEHGEEAIAAPDPTSQGESEGVGETAAPAAGTADEGISVSAESSDEGQSSDPPGDESNTADADGSGSAAIIALISELSQTKTDLAEARAELKAANTDIDLMKATDTGLREAVCSFVNRMQVALGSSATDLSALDSTTLLTQYSQTRNQFLERFPVGAKAEVPVQDDDSDKGSVVSFVQSAAVNATTFPKGRSNR